MRLLILTNSLSGLFSFRKEVVKALRDAGYEVVISAPYEANVSSFFKEVGCELIDTRIDRRGVNPLKDFGLMCKYRFLLHEIKPDIVLSYTIKPNLYGGMACQLKGTPQLANITGLGSAVENPGWLQALTVLLYKIGLRKTHTVFFQNQSNKDFCVSHGMVRGRSVLLPGSGVNLTYHSLKEYPSEDEGVRFVFISRLLREKGIEEYLYAAEKIKMQYQKCEFHILGACEEAYENKLKDLQERGIVIYHGHQPDVRSFIAQMHCTVHPSFYPEGMSNVLLESCAAGRPIITTNRPGCGEIVEDGVNGFVVRQQDGEDVREKIIKFMNLSFEDKRKMGLAARWKVEKEFDRQIVIDAYLNEIARIKKERHSDV